MSQEFDVMVAKVEHENARWRWIAEQSGWTCHRCGQVVIHAELESYFRSGYCGLCEHMYDKIMSED